MERKAYILTVLSTPPHPLLAFPTTLPPHRKQGDLWGEYSAVGFGGPGRCTLGSGTDCPSPSDFYVKPDTDLPWSDSAGASG